MSGQTEKEKPRPNRLVIASDHKLATIHPVLTTSTFSALLIDYIYDGLVWIDDALVPQPRLAESWSPSPDGLVWTFKIRKGVTFHDGSALTAEDVARTYQAIRNLKIKTHWSFAFQEIEQIVVKGPYLLQITLKKPLAAFVQFLWVGILPEHLLTGKDLSAFAGDEKLPGTGPYKLKSWSENETLLEAHEPYYLGTPKINEINVKVFSSPEDIWAQFIAGNIDFLPYIPPDHYEVIKQLPGFNTHISSKPYYYLVAFNLNNPIFEDARVRRALNFAIDKEAIVSMVLSNRGRIANGTILPGSWAHHAELQPYPYNPKTALALLKEAGWEDHDGDHLLDKAGKTLQLTTHINTGDALKEKVMRLIQKQLLDIGIGVEFIFFEAANFNFLIEKSFQSIFLEFLAIPDPHTSYIFWHSSQSEEGANFFSYDNPEVNRLLEAGRTELDPDKRKTIYFQYQEEMYKDPPGIFLFWTDYLAGIHERFKNVTIGPVRNFSNIHEWYISEGDQGAAVTGNEVE